MRKVVKNWGSTKSQFSNKARGMKIENKITSLDILAHVLQHDVEMKPSFLHDVEKFELNILFSRSF